MYHLLALLLSSCLADAEEVEIQADEVVRVQSPLGQLSPKDYFVNVDANDREVYVFMKKRNAKDASDPDLYLRFTNPVTRDLYDYHESSGGAAHSVHLRVNDRSGKLYINVFAFSSPIATLEADVDIWVKKYQCHNRNCGQGDEPSRGTCDIATGTCNCNPGFTISPVCSTVQQTVNFNVEGSRHSEEVTMQNDETIIYEFAIHNPVPHRFRAVIGREYTWGEATVKLMAHNRDAVPIEQNTMYSGDTVTLNVMGDRLTSGYYYLAVQTTRSDPQKFNILIDYQQCENSCSGHGKCDPATQKCTCDKGWTYRPTCTVKNEALTSGNVEKVSIAEFDHSMFQFTVSEAIMMSPSEIVINVETLPQTKVHTYPTVYIKAGSEPTEYDYHYTGPHPTGKSTQIVISKTTATLGNHFLMVSNPGDFPVDVKLSYNVDVYCPPKCSEHGGCTPLGVCKCREGWAGGDCSVNVAKLQDDATDGHVTTVIFVVCIFVFLFAGLAGGVLIQRRCGVKQDDAAPSYNNLQV